MQEKWITWCAAEGPTSCQWTIWRRWFHEDRLTARRETATTTMSFQKLRDRPTRRARWTRLPPSATPSSWPRTTVPSNSASETVSSPFRKRTSSNYTSSTTRLASGASEGSGRCATRRRWRTSQWKKSRKRSSSALNIESSKKTISNLFSTSVKS